MSPRTLSLLEPILRSDFSATALGLWVAAVVCALLASGAPRARASEPPGDVGEGKVLYERYCVSCHGELGDGNGEAAPNISPKPRDYRQGVFKSRSTPSGSLPLPADVEKTLENGLYGTRMPSWYALGHRARRDLIAYIQTFSPRWTTEQPKAPITIPSEPANSQQSVERGREVYQRTGCADCHGDRGLGDGPSAKAGLQDSWGNPIAPANLAKQHSKYGDSGTERYRILMTGIDGTPMPSFGEVLTADQTWDLVHYLENLSHETPPSDQRFGAVSAHQERIATILGFLFGE